MNECCECDWNNGYFRGGKNTHQELEGGWTGAGSCKASLRELNEEGGYRQLGRKLVSLAGFQSLLDLLLVLEYLSVQPVCCFDKTSQLFSMGKLSNIQYGTTERS